MRESVRGACPRAGARAAAALAVYSLLLLFAVVFGLSTDHGVFLRARIKEAREGGDADAEAVAVRLEELGLGTEAAVLVDATIVRALLVPALMRLLGRWNRWAPSALRSLHARIGFGET